MRFSVNTLFNVQFEHSYFTHLFDGFLVRISNTTEHELRNYGLHFKPYPGGFKILYDSEFASRGRSREEILNTGLVLHFSTDLKDSLFFSYTAGNYSNLSNSIFYFSNTQSRQSEVLHKGELVSSENLYKYPLPFKDNFFVKPFAKIVLKLDTDLPELYRIKFEAKSAFWRYILAGPSVKQLKNPAILDEKANVLFAEPVEIKLPANNTAVAIVSKSPLPLSSRPKAIFQLVENYKEGEVKHKTVIRALPAPDINNISRLPDQNGIESNFSDIYIT